VKILVVGGSGMLGSDLVPELLSRGHEVLAPSSSELDITDVVSLAKIPVGEFGRLDWCINCAAYTAVDKAETEVREATELNALAPAYLARACLGNGCRLTHISTDFVFDGEAGAPYDEEAPTNPLGVYGRTKLEGEAAVMETHSNAFVVRTSWLYGPSGSSFPRTIIKAFEAGKQLRVVADQVGCPTYTADLARAISDLVETNPFPGIYHACGPNAMSWHAFAELALKTWTGEDVMVEPIATEDWPTPAKRPPYSVLSTVKLQGLGIKPMRSVADALSDFCQRLPKFG
jgi:dTDP-4-dehydrorhamnose reductase